MCSIIKKIQNRIIRLIKPPHKDEKYLKYSFSQSGEDIIIKYIFDTIEIKNPKYIDIGAHHPYYLNNTYLFYKNGSDGINIEPDETLFTEFIKERSRDTNLNIGVGPIKTTQTFYKMSAPTLNTFSEKDALLYQNEGYKIIDTKSVHIISIDEVLNQYGKGHFYDLLNIDVEGYDEAIIKSIDYKKYSPTVICIETISFSNTGRGIKNTDINSFLTEKGYLLYADTNINSIYVLKNKWEK